VVSALALGQPWPDGEAACMPKQRRGKRLRFNDEAQSLGSTRFRLPKDYGGRKKE
tara:strand:+ start:620 stop:784 length:165 start_codon:yes stop_codon:yes gene_type:complete